MLAFENAVAKVLKAEGGYVNDPLDRGGETNFGITVSVARSFGYTGPIKDLPLETAKAIYKRNYWDSLRLDDVASLSASLAGEVFDSAVNCGVATAGRWFQQAINALTYENVVVDGNVGPATLKVLSGLRRQDIQLVEKLCNIQQGAHYLAITQRNESQERFIRGWLTRVAI